MDNENTNARCCDEYDDYRRQRFSFRQNRRDFLKTTVGAMAAAPAFPHMLLNAALAKKASSAASGPILVVIQLEGGNDGLNTIIPYGSGLYYQDRPNISVPAKSVLPIDGTIGFNPNLSGLKPLFDKGQVAILQGVGYPNPSRSHFQSTQIWETADPNGTTYTGWLGRYLDAEISGERNPLSAVALGSMLPLTLVNQHSSVTAVDSVDAYRFMVSKSNSGPIMDAFQSMYQDANDGSSAYVHLVRSAGKDAESGVSEIQSLNTKYTPSVTYPKNTLGTELQLVAQMIVAGLGTRIFHVTLNGFDDHAAEVKTHATLLKEFGDGVSAFYQDLTNHSQQDNVVTMTFSEFGRRVKENAGLGTDHGTAAPLFVIGTKVKGGMYGDDPILSSLDDNGDLKFGIDFRSVYGTLIDGWLGGSSSSILGGSYERLGFL